MKSFADGEIDVLVTTTVIEVGIDVPNATIMTILGAQRFGLAQLHQLRGRVSRGSHAGHVAIFTDGPQSADEFERLKVLEKTDDGFELAEADFPDAWPGRFARKETKRIAAADDRRLNRGSASDRRSKRRCPGLD